ncbi:MAG: PEGA domain-containing protein [Thermoanaerobaculaceae bacterium]|jgi:hypothetical protein
MKRLCWLCLFLLTVAATVSLAGDIQVSCEPGLRVYLDGKFVGTSSPKDDGLFLADVAGGGHVIRVEKDGFAPQSFQVMVQKLPIEVKVGEFSPEPPPPERVTGSAKVVQLTGNLLVLSAPQNCDVEIDGKSELKTIPLLRIEGLTEGPHAISFSRPGYDTISGVVRVEPGADVIVQGDLKAGKVKTIQEGKGSLRVISTPDHCTVRFLGKTEEKIHASWNLSYVPAGEHRIVISLNGRDLVSNIMIIKGLKTIVTVSFMKGDEPIVVSYEPE